MFANATMGPEYMALTIPLVAILGAVVILITTIVVRGRNVELIHRERILAMEKGLPLPPFETEKPRRPDHSRRRHSGLVMLGLGVSLTIALWVAAGPKGGVWGLIPAFMGVGMLVAAALDRREARPAGDGAPEPAPEVAGLGPEDR